MATRTAAYQYRPAPKAYDPAWVNTELQNLQRSIPTSTVRSSTINTTQLVTDRVVVMQALTAPLTFTLLALDTAPIFPVTVKLAYNSIFQLTIIGTVDGMVNPIIAGPGTSWTMVPDPARTSWWII